MDTRSIVFFDGICNLCNGFVDFSMRRNSSALFYASLQGETAKAILNPASISEMKSLYYFREGRLLEKSEAVLAILEIWGGTWRVLAKSCRLLPIGLRDFIYDFVAKNRYSIFGKRSSCRLPTASERVYFLP